MKTFTNLTSLQASLKNQQITCAEVLNYHLGKIKETAHLNAFIEVFEEEAKAKAKELDDKIKNSEPLGALFGMVVSIKDVICFEGHKTSASSKILANFTSQFSATALRRLLAEDAIVIGNTNCDQFGMGSTNENSIHGPVSNAIDQDFVAGGSSGGAAVSVATDTCHIALGSDTGGSVRQPAAYNGLIGFKPSYGRVSRHGLIAYASSFDQIGVIGKNEEDIARVLEVMAGPDEFDGTAIQEKSPAYFSTLNEATSNIKIALLAEAQQEPGMHPDILAATNNFLAKLKDNGHSVLEKEFELLSKLIATYYILTTAEASSNLSRFDGVRYGHRADTVSSLEEVYTKSRNEGFSMEVKRRILLGTFVLSSGYYDAYFQKAQQVRRKIQVALREILAEVDCIALPVSAGFPQKIGAVSDPVQMYLSDIFTVLANLAGLPAVSFPISNQTDFPVSIQLLTLPSKEKHLLQWAKALSS